MKKWLSAALAIGAFTVGVHAQSLADIAKKTEDQRTDKEKPKAEKVYSNKDLKAPLSGGVGSSDVPSSVVPSAGSTAVVTAAPANSSPSFTKDEGYWRERMRSVHARVDDDQTLLAAATVREKDLDRRLHRSVDDIQFIRDRILRATVESEWTQAVAEVSRLKAAVINDERAVKTAEEEARRADVPPAWLVRVQ